MSSKVQHNLPLQLTYEQSQTLKRLVIDAVETLVARAVGEGLDRTVVELDVARHLARYAVNAGVLDVARVGPEDQ